MGKSPRMWAWGRHPVGKGAGHPREGSGNVADIRHIQRADGLTHKQEQAIVALLNEPTVARAARSLGLSEKSLYRWLDERAFGRAYRKARREAFAQAIANSQRYAPLAVQMLAKIMADETLSVSARVSAASILLKFSRESIELDDLAQRVDELEGRWSEEPESGPRLTCA